MWIRSVPLWDHTPGLCQEAPTLDIYLPEEKTSPIAVVIFPGGSYTHHAGHEGKGYAEFLNSHGIAAFVCNYRLHPHHFPLPLLDARRAMRYVRYHSEEFGICKDKVYVMGSSAGGHLAALTSTYYDAIDFEGLDEIDKESAKPNGQILCYPVIALLEKGIAHRWSGQNFLGSRHEELGDALTPYNIADSSTPPAFIWHTFDDGSVSVANSLRYAQRLQQMGVNIELHIYPHGHHGLGLATDVPHVQTWTQGLLEWLAIQNEQNGQA